MFASLDIIITLISRYRHVHLILTVSRGQSRCPLPAQISKRLFVRHLSRLLSFKSIWTQVTWVRLNSLIKHRLDYKQPLFFSKYRQVAKRASSDVASAVVTSAHFTLSVILACLLVLRLSPRFSRKRETSVRRYQSHGLAYMAIFITH